MCYLSPSTTTFIPTSASLYPLWPLFFPFISFSVSTFRFSFLFLVSQTFVSRLAWICAVDAPCSTSVKSTWAPLQGRQSSGGSLRSCRRIAADRSPSQQDSFALVGFVGQHPLFHHHWLNTAAWRRRAYRCTLRVLFHPSLVHSFHTRSRNI